MRYAVRLGSITCMGKREIKTFQTESDRLKYIQEMENEGFSVRMTPMIPGSNRTRPLKIIHH